MAEGDDNIRVAAFCTNCESVYAARQWPEGDIQPIGSERCSCGSTDFALVTDAEDGAPPTETNTE